MSINGFMPKNVNVNVNVNKKSVVLVVGLVTNNAVVDVVKSCKELLIKISNKISKDLQRVLFESDSDMSEEKNDKNNDKEDDSRRNNKEVVVNTNVYSKKVKKIFCESSFFEKGVFIASEKLFKWYMKYKVCKGESANQGIILLMFIIFIYAIRQRKIIDRNNIYKIFLV
jgi:hypothetical protein